MKLDSSQKQEKKLRRRKIITSCRAVFCSPGSSEYDMIRRTYSLVLTAAVWKIDLRRQSKKQGEELKLLE